MSKKSILISIKPKWVVKILNGEKTIEIRKTMPKCDLPIDVYIYCTKQNARYYIKNKIYNSMINGKVIARFTLNYIGELKVIHDDIYDNMVIPDICITHKELENYLKDNVGYSWHISNLVIFDEPKELSKFIQSKRKNYDEPQVQKAPQSFCYIEVE